MTDFPNKIPDIDQAWEDKLGGLVLTSGASVAFFQEFPSVDSIPQLTFPAISTQLIGINSDSPRWEGRPEDLQVGTIAGAVPQSEMIEVPTPYRLLYTVDTWAKARARDDRELLQHIMATVGDTDTLFDPVTNELVHVFKTGFNAIDETNGDIRIYHKSFTYEVLVTLGSDTVALLAQAVEVNFDFYGSQTIPESGPVSSDTFLQFDLRRTVTG